MIRDPSRRGLALAEFFLAIEPRLYADLGEAGVLPAADDPVRVERARAEWQCFALYACVRGLIAAGGFNRETGTAIEVLHERVVSAWRDAVARAGAGAGTGAAVEASDGAGTVAGVEAGVEGGAEAGAGSDQAMRQRIAERYAEYGTIGQTGGASAAATVGIRLGEAAARHMAGDAVAGTALAELVGGLHESLAEGAAEAVRQAE